ncbi:hypothetical protein [Kamptonema formosum]|uniref:hypothetical protein n=1 Tax=Kamptonema formosum TaxID=331992 RepID=UPI0003460154|nr:hypothetical protein [Oscillatoria sp. PCC 10802]
MKTQPHATGNLNLQAGDPVRVRDGPAAAGAISGGNLTIQGDRSTGTLALNHPFPDLTSAGHIILASDGNISGGAHPRVPVASSRRSILPVVRGSLPVRTLRFYRKSG